jgi:hypothetical protein
MQTDRLANILKEGVDRRPLRKDIFADAPGTPTLSVVIDLNFNEHALS